MIVIGIDPNKSTHTATAVDPAINTDLDSIRIDAAAAVCVAALQGDARPVDP